MNSPILAVIDVGSNSMRMQVAKARPDGSYAVIAEERAAVRLGTDVFRTGHLAERAIDRCAEAMRRFAAVARRHGASQVRAVATSAVREASNRAPLLAKVKKASGLRLEVISGAEEARLICLGVAQGTPREKELLLIDIGGGSTELTATQGDQAVSSVSLPLGAVRLTELFVTHDPPTKKEQDLVAEAVRGAMSGVPPLFVGRFKRALGSAGTIGAVVGLAQGGPRGPRLKPVAASKVRAVRKLAGRLTSKQRAQLTDPHRADILFAGAAILEGILTHLRVDEIEATSRGLRDGLMADLVQRTVAPRGGFNTNVAVREGLRAFGRKCQYREDHAEQVAWLAREIFDQTEKLHGLGPDARALLDAAALLHDIGNFVSYNRHHKHAYYLIYWGDLPGFTDREREIIANVARYHRRSPPSPSHSPFAALAPDEQQLVTRLAAILRIAEALDRGHQRHVARLTLRIVKKKILFDAEVQADSDLELFSANERADLFRAVFGVKTEFRAKEVR